ncbi:hypothetical protein L6164_037648 [Bauhinia variegata]|uniref:Uncharacterized protein n=1 Tax=Bauhinia variegata TaxID=167791 RepID=A0ACB9KKU1_BAUVA|nr:hypothetical protein L6164_037648 [Bauhinia variegata]
MAGGRFRELIKKYGKVAVGVHLSVSAISITGLYVAIKNNVDVESLFEKVHMGSILPKNDKEKIPTGSTPVESEVSFVMEESTASDNQLPVVVEEKKSSRTAELAASSGGALALAVLCNKALFPIRVPITIALTPPISRFLARRKIYKTGK